MIVLRSGTHLPSSKSLGQNFKEEGVMITQFPPHTTLKWYKCICWREELILPKWSYSNKKPQLIRRNIRWCFSEPCFQNVSSVDSKISYPQLLFCFNKFDFSSLIIECRYYKLYQVPRNHPLLIPVQERQQERFVGLDVGADCYSQMANTLMLRGRLR